MNNIILTSYFNSVRDQQRGKFWQGNNYNVIKGWYESVIRLRLKAIVFHDHLEERFMKKYDKVTYLKYEPKGDPTSARFTCYLDHLLLNKYDNVFLTDISDVVINKDPFPLIEKDFVIIGYEENTICKGGWVEKFFNNAYGMILYEGMRVLNPGIIGGEYSLIGELLELFNKELEGCGHRKMIDLAIWNAIIYGKRYSYKTGYPIITRFGKEETNDCYFKHK